MKYNDSWYTLSTGRKFYANCGIIGMSRFKKDEFGKFTLSLSEGYDGGISADDFSTREQMEIANYIIWQWNLYRLFVVWFAIKKLFKSFLTSQPQ